MPLVLLLGSTSTSRIGIVVDGPANEVDPALLRPNPQKVRGDKAKVEAAGFWIYNDLPKAVAEAKADRQADRRRAPLHPVRGVRQARRRPGRSGRAAAAAAREVRPRADHLDQRAGPVAVSVRHRPVVRGLPAERRRHDLRPVRHALGPDRTGPTMSRSKGWPRHWKGRWPCTRTIRRTRRRWPPSAGPRPTFPCPRSSRCSRRNTARSSTTKGTSCKAASTATRSATPSGSSTATKSVTLPEQVLFPYPHPKALGLILDPEGTGDGAARGGRLAGRARQAFTRAT